MFQCKRFQIIKERIYQGTCVREGVHWNSHPGALFLQSSATAVTNFPFPGPGSPTLNNHPAIQSTTGPLIGDTHFTAVIFTTTTPQLSSGSSTGTGSSSYIHHNNPIFKLVASVAASQYVDKVTNFYTLSASKFFPFACGFVGPYSRFMQSCHVWISLVSDAQL